MIQSPADRTKKLRQDVELDTMEMEELMKEIEIIEQRVSKTETVVQVKRRKSIEGVDRSSLQVEHK